MDHDEPVRPTSLNPGSAASMAGYFATTHWSVVLAAGETPTPQSAEALERLCATYWYPLFAYLRRSGYDPHDAQDLTQSFFVHLLGKERLRSVSPDKGKFRSFLLASLKNFLANEWDKRQTLKRGGQFVFLPLDPMPGEERFQREPSHNATPDKAFEQSWAMSLLDKTLNHLREEFADQQKRTLFDSLQIYLSGDKGTLSYAEMALRLNLTEGAVKMAVLRLRRRFGELLRAEIAQTVSSSSEVDEEIRYLFAAVGS